MWQFILGSTGFILYFIYDINSVRMKNAVLQKFFCSWEYSRCSITDCRALCKHGGVASGRSEQ